MHTFVRALVAAVTVLPVASLAQSGGPQTTTPGVLEKRVRAALPEARDELDTVLADYSSARFRNVQARLVRSVFASDDGQSNKVPWLHRGGVVLVFCGEVNAKNRMGGFTGWEKFALQPKQVDVVTLYSFEKPRQPKPTNIAAEPKFMSASNLYDEHLGLMCGNEAEVIDPTDLSGSLTYVE
ncbi:hypothetical protein M0208_00975 [Sphingomonas sp. SUN019]|uniref:hypothetical protein n=1 Tax=Sphingomonas sp. SUN019 TaxID=2937788 RepID=UPI0021642CFC|nr:hypothetical protein [Sphingomonas sp. SUN019]UVO49159.1 hypothetical protein M0208_00975 [Sphingomonas sp. SUN019]